MRKIMPIVEGEGDVAALPPLLHNVLRTMHRSDIGIALPKNANGIGNLTASRNIGKTNGIEHFVERAWQDPDCAAAFVLVDSDKNCPVTLARDLSLRVQRYGLKHPAVVVAAHSRFETWFIASLASIVGKDWDGLPGLPKGLTYSGNGEGRGDAEHFINKHLPKGRKYSKARDQKTLARMIDVEIAKANSRSFRRLCHAVEEVLAAIDQNLKIVSPAP